MQKNKERPLVNLAPQQKPEKTAEQRYDDICAAIDAANNGYWRPTPKELAELQKERQELAYAAKNHVVRI